MNILMVTMSLGIGGAETHILELVRELLGRGHTVTIASAGGIFVNDLVAAGAKHIPMPLHTKRPDAMAKSRRLLFRLLREEKFDIIHAHARIPGFIAAGAAKHFDIPFVTTFHGTFNPVWYLRMLTRVGERTLAVSDDVKQYLMQYYHTPPEKIGVTVNGIDVTSYDAPAPDVKSAVRAELGVPSGEIIMAVSRLDRAAAWHVFRLIEAMPEILSERPDARLVIVGGGDVLEEIRTLAAQTDAQLGGKRIFITGPRSDISRVLAAADIFVGVSRAAMEAMACRLPVILSGAQGHLGIFHPAMEAEAVETNFCCRTREPVDTVTLARAVITLLAAPDAEKAEMGAYNRALVARLYSVARMADDAETLYRQAMEEHRFRRADVVISGYYGFSNAGDDALLSQISRGLRERGITRIAALSRRGAELSPGVTPVNRFHVISLWRAIRHSRLLISGGGSLLQDVTSAKSLFYYTTVMRAAKRSGVPVMVFANGIGPLRRESSRRRAVKALQAADYISVRENASARELTAMGIPEEKIRVTADPVYRMASDKPREHAGEYVILSLRETADGQDVAGAENAAVQALTEICRSCGMQAVLLPMQPRYDSGICARAAERLSEAGVEVRTADGTDAAETEEMIRGARAVIGMRLHAVIFAAAAGVPSLALSYDPKLDAMMEYLGMEEFVLSAADADGETLRAKLAELLSRENEIAEKLRLRGAALRALAEEDLDAAAEFVNG